MPTKKGTEFTDSKNICCSIWKQNKIILAETDILMTYIVYVYYFFFLHICGKDSE